MEKENEIWKDIPNYEGYYQVSDLGRVKSLSRQILNRHGYWDSKERILKQALNSNGYSHIVTSKNCKTKSIKVHVLVAISFLGHKPDGSHKVVVDHVNNNKSDNRLCNLQLISCRKNNSKDKINKTSKYTGVYLLKSGKFESKIFHINKKVYLGTFETEEEASEYYQKAVESIENGEEIKHNRKEQSSKFKGVNWNKNANKWVSYVFLNNKRKHIGIFQTEEEAYEERRKYLEKLK
jgi:hypothetical protein